MSIPTKNINAEKIQGNLDVTSISGGTIFSGTTELTTIIQNIVSGNQITGTTGSVAFFGSGNTITQDNSNFFWDNTNKRLGIRESAPDSSLVIRGAGTTSSTFALKVHNSTGTNNALVVRDDGFIGMGYNSPFGTEKVRINGGTRIQGFLVAAGANGAVTLNNGFISQQHGFNGFLSNTISNVDGGNNTSVGHIFPYGFGGQDFGYLIQTNLGYSNQLFGGEKSSLILYNKAQQNPPGKIKFVLGTGSQSALNNCKFEWIGAVTGNDPSLGFGTPTPRMTLNAGTGNLLLGTATEVASSILTLASTTKGFLPPRMTAAQRNAISSPATGLTLYNTTTNTLDVRDNTQWKSLSTIDQLQIALTAQVFS